MTSLMIGLALTIAAPGAKDPPKKEQPSLLGNWIGESVIKGGKPSPPVGATMEFTKEGTVVVKEHGTEITGTYKINSKKSPGELDITVSAGGQSFNLPGIYKTEGDTFTICFSLGGVRPTKFESPDGSMTSLLTLKRDKKK